MRVAHKTSLPILLTVLTLAACTLADEYGGDEPEGRQANFVASDSNSYTRSTPAGDVLTTPDGMTVYIYDKEAEGSASCYGACADEWPPVLAPTDAKPFGDFSLVKRIDGTRQWAYGGKPLHLYREDSAPGDAKGDNYEGFWHVVEAPR
jgi:predicted lipoprotein with Yx(FWY)xxD motif